jgi:hypothetical protein
MMRSTTVAAAFALLLLLASSAAAGRQLKDAHNLTATVNLGTAAEFVILGSAGVSTVPASVVTGDIGVSPVALSYVTGFDYILGSDENATFATASQVTGSIYAADLSSPTPSKMTTAVSDFNTAYTDAAGRTTANVNLYDGILGGKTFTTGVYKFTEGVTIDADMYINGTSTDIFIFQISKTLTVASAVRVTLGGGALAKNIFWQVAETVSFGTTSHFEGIILAATGVTFKTGASHNGRVFSRTAVSLQVATITQP